MVRGLVFPEQQLLSAITNTFFLTNLGDAAALLGNEDRHFFIALYNLHVKELSPFLFWVCPYSNKLTNQ
jgi:hypothetical protein